MLCGSLRALDCGGRLRRVIYRVSNPATWAVVVPTFNHAPDAITCLSSLWEARPRPGTVLLVDDHSTDDAVERIVEWAGRNQVPHRLVPARNLPDATPGESWLTIIASATNAGFVRTCNIGLQYLRDRTTVPYVLLLNNDAAVSPSYFADLSDAVRQVPDAGLLSGTIYEWDRTTVWYAGASFNPLRALARHHTELPAGDAPRETGYICGCSMLISRRVLEEVGLLADCFRPIYVEDVDYSLRARAAGFKVVYAPTPVCYHRVGSSLGRTTQQSPQTTYAVTRNRAYTVRRNYRGWRRAAGLAYMAITKPGRALLELVRGRPRMARAFLYGMLTGNFSDIPDARAKT